MTQEEKSALADREANIFAIGFLMPKTIFIDKYKEFNKNIYRLAGYFLVPIVVVEAAIKLYGLEE